MKSIIILFLALLLRISNAAEQSTADETQATRSRNRHRRLANPFLSTTLSTEITSVSNHLAFDSDRKTAFSETLTRFFHKIFEDQQAYDVTIISVNVFDDHILQEDGRYVEEDRPSQIDGKNDGDDGMTTLSFSTVVSAEYTREDQIDSIAKDNFRKMLIHVSDKFQSHLIQFVRDNEDPYFMGVERVTLGDFERMHVGAEGGGGGGNSNETVMGLSHETVNTASIVAIAVGGLAFLVLAFASAKYYREEKQIRAVALMTGVPPSSTRSVAWSHKGTLQSGPSTLDDYSFNPFGAVEPYNPTSVTSRISYSDSPTIQAQDAPSNVNDETVSFSSALSQSAPPTLFPARVAPSVVEAAAPELPPSYTEELAKLSKQHVYAPPGKIGVAIDVVNGQPMVHKVRKNSPLESTLRPNDIILAIDDEDASCMSAADVTSMMVKRMDRVRKITFVRRGR